MADAAGLQLGGFELQGSTIEGRRARFEIVTPERLADGTWRCAVEFALP